MTSAFRFRRCSASRRGVARASIFALAALPVPLLIAPRIVRAQTPAQAPPANASPVQATVTAVNGRAVTLDIGADNGARVGAVYGLIRDGLVRAQIQITQVRAGDSSGVIVEAADDVFVTVGDAVSFITQRDLAPATPTQPTTPTQPATPPDVPAPTGELGPDGQPMNTPPVAPANPPATGTPETGTPQTVTPGTTPPIASGGATGVTARVTSSVGGVVTLDVGINGGARTGTNVPVVRNGNVVAVLHLDIATGNTATASVLWQADANAPVVTGDVVTLPPAPDAPGSTLGGTVQDLDQTPIVASPVRYESGASNAIVPRADRTYERLAALAASGLIRRYPAHVFHDEGTRFHRTEEDITFTRAQIADLVREAITSEDAEDTSTRNKLALSALTRDYNRELRKLGVEAATLQEFAPTGGFRLGVSGQTRASLVKNQNVNTNVVEPFSERQGGRRTRSGLDVRTNIEGQINPRLTFFSTIDSGGDPRRDENARAFTVRRAIASLDASNLVRGLRVEAGRDELWFGPGHFGTLLLGDTPGGFNLLHSIFQRGSYRLDSVYAPLGRGPAGSQRALYAKNFQVQLSKQTRIGFAESTLAPNSSFQLPQFLATFSPIPIFTVERLANGNNKNRSGNTLVQGYFETSVANGFAGYGEFLIDDIGVNSNNNARNRIGTLLGAHIYTPRDPARLGLYLEYANLNFRTYRRFNESNDADYDYFYRGRPIGYPVAPTDDALLRGAGAESLRLNAYWRAARRLRLDGGLEFSDINSEGPLLARQQIYRFRAAYDLSRNLTLVGRVQRVATTNAPTSPYGAPILRGALSQRLFQLELARAF